MATVTTASSIRNIIIGWLGLLLITWVGLAMFWWLIPEHGVLRTHSNNTDYQHQGRWLWLTIGGHSFSTEDGLARVTQVEHRGSVYLGEVSAHTWQIQHSGNLSINIDGNTVFQRDDFNTLTTDILSFETSNAWADIVITSQVDINTARTVFPYRTEMRLYNQGLFGRWQIIPYYRLYPTQISDAQAQQHVFIGQAVSSLIVLSMMAILGLASTLIWHNRHQQRLWIALGIMALALIVRVIVWWQRSLNDPLFYFLAPAGDDNYVLWAQQWLSGQYQLAGTFWPPTPIVINALIAIVFGSPIWTVMLVNILLTTVAAGAVVVSGWLAFAQKRIGIIAGLIFALFPPLVFYTTTTQSVVLDATFIAFAICAGLYAIKYESFTSAGLFGMFISIAGMSRGIALLLGLAFFFALLMRHRVRGIQLTFVAGIISVLTLMPQIVANASATGDWSLIPYGNGNLTLYSGNNRDANGLWTGRGMAWQVEQLSGEHWDEALLADFRDDPMRMFELNLRKIAIFWNNIEYVSNVNYYQQGTGSSSLLAVLSQNNLFGMLLLSGFVWMGIGTLIQARDRESWFILWSTLLLLLGTTLFVLAGRLRVPLMPLLALLASVGIASLWELIIKRQEIRRHLSALVFAGAVMLIMPIIEWNLPRKDSDDLSSTAITLDSTFFDEIVLIAHEPLRSDFEAGGYVYLTLYWQVLSEASHDYRVFVELADDNGRVIGLDRDLGTISYPPQLATAMQIGQVIEEGYLLRLPEVVPSVMTVNVGLYPPDAPDNSQRLSLFQMGIREDIVVETTQPAQYYIGEQLAVTDITPPRVHEQSILVGVTLQTEAHIPDDWVLFTHVLDEDNNLVAQVDSPFVIDERTVSSLVPDVPLTMQRRIPLPDDLSAGQYHVVMGAYQLPDVISLPLTNASDNSPMMTIPLGEIALP
ncbi:MAG: hypothetical protein AAF846_29725 [Chloroflexota bacterium]